MKKAKLEQSATGDEMNCKDCGTPMRRAGWIETETAVYGGTVRGKTLWQCPKCKRVDLK